MTSDDALSRLSAIPDLGVVSDPHDMETHLVDWRRRHRGTALAVLFPATVEAVSAALRLCGELTLKVFPQGGNTSVCGGSVPDTHGGSVVLNLARMNRIRALDPDDDSMIVDAGCILAEIQQAAAHAGRLFPMSLGAEGSCQIGGTIATNAGGTAVLRYGNMRDLVLGLEVVLPDGTIWNGLRTLRKNNSGYDLRNLFIGSEGTLGIVTGAALKLVAQPSSTVTGFLAVSCAKACVAIGQRLRQAFPGEVSALEIMSRSQIDIVLRHIDQARLPLSQTAPWYLLIEISGAAASADLEERATEVLAGFMEDGDVADAVLASNARQRDELWALRHNVTEANVKHGMGLTHDIAVPIARIDRFVDRAGDALAASVPEARPVVVGHMGDGNLHYIAMIPHEDWARVEDKPLRALNVGHLLYDIALDLGGTFSAEHGIGSIHVADMARYKPSEEVRMMRQIKTLLDPAGMMNPGRVLPAQ